MFASRFLRKELPAWISTLILGLDIVGRGTILLLVAPSIHRVSTGWSEALRKTTGALIAACHLSARPGFQNLAAFDIELFIIVIIAFVYFGITPYWIRARRAGANIFLNYPLHLLCWGLLTFLLLQAAGLISLSGALQMPPNIWIPTNAFEAGLAVGTASLVATALFWHPGIALRALVGILILELIAALPAAVQIAAEQS